MVKLIPLIDADILTYRAGFAADKKKYVPYVDGVAHPELSSVKELKAWKELHKEESIDVEHKLVVEPVENCLQMVRTSLSAIEAVVGSNMELYLTGRGNFREQISTLRKYKGNRSEFDRPTHYAAIREYLQRMWGARMVDGQEADDAIGIRTYEIKESEEEASAIIVSIDKDLDMLEGFHYNWVTGAKYKISERQAIRNFYLQMLTGDKTDNIPGIHGVGPKTAEDILGEYTKEKALYTCVRDTWNRYYPEGYEGRSVDSVLKEIGQLLWIRRERDELWEPPL